MTLASRSLAGGALALLGAACGDAASTPRATPTAVASADSTVPAPAGALRFRVDTLARGLEIPWSLAFAPDGRILVTERPGTIRVIRDGVLEAAPWATLEVYSRDTDFWPEAGLMGIALAPDFARSRHVYVMATVRRSAAVRDPGFLRRAWRAAAERIAPRRALPFKSQIIRFTDDGIRGTDPAVIVDDLPANHYHAGGALAFGPDGKLYATVGDAIHPPWAQEDDVLAGKVLRYEPDGSIPADNPDPSSAVWSRGLRNVQSVRWLPDGTMLATEHGPTGMQQEGERAGRDELNVIVPGGNYGWPSASGWEVADSSRAPLWVWRTAIAPGGMEVWSASPDGTRATLLVGGLRRLLERVELGRDGAAWRVVARDSVLDGTWGRLRAVQRGPDGALYLTTSNRDIRGQAGPADDLILRLTPLP